MNAQWLLSSPILIPVLLVCLMLACAGCAGLFYRTRVLTTERDEANSAAEMSMIQLRKSMQIDQLTGLLSRQRLTEIAKIEMARCRRYGHPLSVVCMDIDHFNQINRDYSDTVGDSVLNGLARMTQALIRQSDAVCRWNGGAFLLLLPHTGLEQALELAEKLRRQAGDAAFLVDNHVSVTIGSACLSTQESFESMTRRAEDALHQAKSEGRNRSLGHHSAEDTIRLSGHAAGS
jgi:diguanylate cyclase (GGDEF)-like protein